MSNQTNELTLPNDMIRQLVAKGWLLGDPKKCNRDLNACKSDING
jgi:hypothetical protein